MIKGTRKLNSYGSTHGVDISIHEASNLDLTLVVVLVVRVTTTPLPHATEAYGQLFGRDFNPLDLLLLLRTV